LYSKPDIIRVIKSRRVRQAGHVEHIWEMVNTYKIFVVKYEERRLRERIKISV
jgi:hypothetical protein